MITATDIIISATPEYNAIRIFAVIIISVAVLTN